VVRPTGTSRWPFRGPGPWLGAAIVVALVVATVVGGTDDPSAAQFGTATSTIPLPSPTTLVPPVDPQGRIAYVTPAGDVTVANSNGTNPLVIGSGAVANSLGLAPLAWSPDGALVAYVRQDGDLVLASADGTAPPIIAATDAVVQPQTNEDVLSFDVTGRGVAYLEKGPGAVAIAAVAVYDGPDTGTIIPLTDPTTRVPVEFQFSPLDPYLYLQSQDAQTGQNLSVAVVDPLNHQPFGLPLTLDEPAFAPDGAFLYGVARTATGDQLVQLDANTAVTGILQNQDRICHPAASPDGTKVVYGAGPDCSQVWVIDSDGTKPKEVARSAGGRVGFTQGDFSWSFDGAVVSHAACRHDNGTSGPIHCDGPYIDIEMSNGKVTTGAAAGSVAREFRPLIKPLKVSVAITGPLKYSGAMLVPPEPSAKLLQTPTNPIVSATLVDQSDPSRIFDVKFLATNNSTYVVGRVHVSDPSKHFDQDMMVFGQVAIQSYRRALFRGIWLQTSQMPFTTGSIDLSIYR
jgi:hypothetical protein